MTEYIRHIEEYSVHGYSSFSNLVPSENWGNKEFARRYLEKYWLLEHEYLSTWKPLQDKIFIQGRTLPDLIFNDEFELIALRGGCLFMEDDFNQLQKVMREVGENYFVIIQDSQNFTEGEPMFKMKFPASITWKELASGNYISAVLLEMSYNEYFVFGESGSWGKYSANDYKNPLDIIGFKPELSSIFQERFKQTKEEHDEIREWLPPKYKKLIK